MADLPRTADAVIVGGGCMGASTAFHLARLGVANVVLVERDTQLATGSTGRNAGGVRHQFSHESNIRLSLESIATMEHFEDVTGAAIDLHLDGYLFLLATPAAVESFERNVVLQRRLGVAVDVLTPDEARSIAPGLATEGVLAATFCARDGIADPNGVTMGFARAAQRLGVAVARDTEVVGIDVDPEHQRVTGVRTSRGRIDTPVVVNAAGPWAREIGRMAGLDVPVSPIRRHIFIAQPGSPSGWVPGSVPASRVLVIDFETSFYFHREGGNVLFGMGERGEQPTFDTTVQWEFLEQITPVATRRLPAIAEAPIAKAWAGLYEMTPDAMPIIGAARRLSGYWLVTGFSGHGFQHSPAAGRILADLIVARDPGPIDLAPFAFERFASGDVSAERNVV
ncbi:MAG: FAD-binding oxidoreductase [Vicinamibacterales bacterium]